MHIDIHMYSGTSRFNNLYTSTQTTPATSSHIQTTLTEIDQLLRPAETKHSRAEHHSQLPDQTDFCRMFTFITHTSLPRYGAGSYKHEKSALKCLYDELQEKKRRFHHTNELYKACQ